MVGERRTRSGRRSKDTRATRVISVWRLDSIAMRGKIKEETTKQYPRAGKLSVLSGSGFKFAAFVLDSVLFFFFFQYLPRTKFNSAFRLVVFGRDDRFSEN